MTDRVQALTVVLEQDIREDDAHQLVRAIKQLRGVADVGLLIVNVDAYVARTRAKQGLIEKILAILEGDE